MQTNNTAHSKKEDLMKLLFLPTTLVPGEARPHVAFDFESYCKKNLGLNLDKLQNIEVCQYYLKNQCRLGSK